MIVDIFNAQLIKVWKNEKEKFNCFAEVVNVFAVIIGDEFGIDNYKLYKEWINNFGMEWILELKRGDD